MGIALTDDHRELSEVARSFLTAQKARAAARELLDAEEESRPTFWTDLAELGWLGLHVDEQYGGSGFGLPELPDGEDDSASQLRPAAYKAALLSSSSR